MQRVNVALFGASGFTGLELTRLLARHGKVSLKVATSDRWEGQSVAERVPGAPSKLTYCSVEHGLREAAKTCDVALLATPAESSLELVQALCGPLKVIDLSGAFRLKDASLYPPFYGFQQKYGALLKAAVYGLPELFRQSITSKTVLVANPGCYATAAALSIAPAVEAGLVDPANIVITGASGVSGAGRKATEDYSFMEIGDDYRAYKVLKHQHTPEIAQTLSQLGGLTVDPVFTPHLLPMKRGILITTVATLKKGATAASVKSAYADAYAHEPLVKLKASADAVRVAAVANTPLTHVGVSVEGRRLVAVSAVDNLLKGAASQAVQNLNLLCGFPEVSGLES